MKDIIASGEHDPFGAVLRQCMRADPLSAAALLRIHAATTREWRSVVRPARQPPALARYAVAAGLALLVLAGGWTVRNRNPATGSAPVIGRLERVDYPGALERHQWSRDRALANGDAVRVGQQIQLRGGARIVLNQSGSLRMAAGTEIDVVSTREIRLDDGDLYVDIPPEHSSEVQLAVLTPAGTFTHTGTQFQLAVHEGATQLRVREGKVRWRSAVGELLSGAGTQLSIDRLGNTTRIAIPTAGSEWSWAEALSSSLDIENRPLADFLQQVARETGRTLAFSDAATEGRVRSTVLHGSMQGLGNIEALSAVMATTSLRFSLDRTSIRIEPAPR